MDFPFFEIQLKPRKAESGEYIAGCIVMEHTGDTVHVLLPRWELKNKKYENDEAANKIMTINALQYLKREYGLKDTSQIKISKDTQ